MFLGDEALMGSIAKLGDTITGLASRVDDKQKSAGNVFSYSVGIDF